jgi:Holliday junction resolvase-like predicted endonuclease
MTKGRRPRKAIDEAVDIAGRRGDVEELISKRGGAFDFIINEPDRVVYVKVKRSQSSFTYALEVVHKYQRELASLHRVALTNVTAREFWVRSPNGTWQYLLIRHDSVLEVRADGMYIPCESIPVRTVDLSDVPADGADDHESPSEDPE